MTKLISVRVTIPTGDDVTTDALQTAIRGALEPIAVLSRPDEEAKDVRIHWSAVDVVRLVDRDRAAAAEKRVRKAPAPPQLVQGSLS